MQPTTQDSPRARQLTTTTPRAHSKRAPHARRLSSRNASSKTRLAPDGRRHRDPDASPRPPTYTRPSRITTVQRAHSALLTHHTDAPRARLTPLTAYEHDSVRFTSNAPHYLFALYRPPWPPPACGSADGARWPTARATWPPSPLAPESAFTSSQRRRRRRRLRQARESDMVGGDRGHHLLAVAARRRRLRPLRRHVDVWRWQTRREEAQSHDRQDDAAAICAEVGRA